MSAYFQTLEAESNLATKSGASAEISIEFRSISSLVISECSFLQNMIQQIIFISYGSQLIAANNTLKKLPGPKARLDFLCQFPYETEDGIVNRVFNYARTKFKEIYQLRNVLAHEVWSSSDQFPDAVLFSALESNAGLLMASGKIWHSDSPTPKETYDATIRFIRAVKLIKLNHLELALSEISSCNWSLMNISNILTESDTQRKDEARRAFRVFRGTSHLFGDFPVDLNPVDFSSKRSKSISE